MSSLIETYNESIKDIIDDIINKIEILIKKLIFLIKSRKLLYNSKNEIMIYNNIKYFTFHFFNNTKLIYITIFILLSTIWGFTKHNPLHNQINSSDSIMHYKRYESLPLLCDWMKNHLPKNAVLFINDKNNNDTNVSLSFAIKCFGHRATFTDYVFPFNESSLLEWGARLDYYKNFDKLTINKFLEISKEYSITHLLIANYTNDKFANYPYIWKSKDFILYDIEQFH